MTTQVLKIFRNLPGTFKSAIRLNGGPRCWRRRFNDHCEWKNSIWHWTTWCTALSWYIILSHAANVAEMDIGRWLTTMRPTHIPEVYQDGKLSTRIQELVFSGYCKRNSYRVFLKQSKKVISSQDVTFDEKKTGLDNGSTELDEKVTFELKKWRKSVYQMTIKIPSGPIKLSSLRSWIRIRMIFHMWKYWNWGGWCKIFKAEQSNISPKFATLNKKTARKYPNHYGYTNVCLVTEALISMQSQAISFMYDAAISSSDSLYWHKKCKKTWPYLRNRTRVHWWRFLIQESKSKQCGCMTYNWTETNV